MKNKLKPIVYIICGVFNNLKYTKKFLNCIEKQSYPNINILIIDDGSTDGTYEYIKKNYSDVIVLKGDGSLWWTGAIYWGVEEVLKIANQNDFILTSNNDCIFDDNYIENLLKTSLSNKRAVVGSLGIDSNNKKLIYDAGIQIDWSRGEFIQLGPKLVKDLSGKIKTQEAIDTLSTKGTLFPIEVFKKIGNFDKKNFPHYLSDYEFACRVKTAGFKLILSYDSRVFNDIKRTGLNNSFRDKVGFKQAFDILFSRRSKLNIIDNYRFIKLCCPSQYKMKNYILLGKKILESLNLQISNFFLKNEN